LRIQKIDGPAFVVDVADEGDKCKNGKYTTKFLHVRLRRSTRSLCNNQDGILQSSKKRLQRKNQHKRHLTSCRYMGLTFSFFFQAIQCEICCLFLYPIGALYELINQKLVYYIIPKYLFTKSMILFVSLSRIKVTEEIDYLLGCRCTSIASFLSYHISS